MSTKPEDGRKQVDNPIWDFVGWLVFEGTVRRGVWALVVALVSLVTE